MTTTIQRDGILINLLVYGFEQVYCIVINITVEVCITQFIAIGKADMNPISQINNILDMLNLLRVKVQEVLFDKPVQRVFYIVAVAVAEV